MPDAGVVVILPGTMAGSTNNMGRDARNEAAGVLVRSPAGGPTVESALLAFASEPQPFVLESTAPDHRDGRFSVLGFDPIENIESDASDGPRWLDDLEQHVGKGERRCGHPGLPFVGGWVGYVAYEAGPALENVRCSKPRDIALPRVRFALYDTVALFDHRQQRWSLAAVDPAGRAGKKRLPPSQRLDALQARLWHAPPAPPIDWSHSPADEPAPVITRDGYMDRIRTAKRYIEAGDICQVNLTQRFSAACHASPIDVYRRLRVSNPAPLSALLTYGQSAVISASPELLLTLRDRQIVTRPIKGTRPRTGDDVLDAIRAIDLPSSEKDRAELNMIVDLLRNDLGKVSDFGTVRVVSPGELEAHPTVFHLAATIEGRLRGRSGWADLLRAAFPGGSITGAPKIRAMQIIDELEPTERSVYCGAIGCIGLDGSMCLNIAIRTMLLDRGRIHLFSGGAIVADSDPQDEYDETLAKIAGLKGALSAGLDRMNPAAPEPPDSSGAHAMSASQRTCSDGDVQPFQLLDSRPPQ